MQGLDLIDMVVREAMLFAGAGLLIGGLDDLLVDLVYLARRALGRGSRRMAIADLPPAPPLRLAVLVPAWDESAVIGRMLEATRARLGPGDWRLYVGSYPNDPATIAAVTGVSSHEPRIRLVIGARPGPTTKADCLNTLWHALVDEDACSGQKTDAIILHDAEDVVHPAELRVFTALLATNDVVQLPVVPLIDRDSRFVSAHYADEFAESHGKAMVVRTALGAAMPLAGTGCAIRTTTLASIAEARDGDPFDAQSLVEDYELGLRIAGLGGRGVFARIADGDGLVAVRSLFPGTLGPAIRQKARWMTGIALAGWDRTGWTPRRFALADHWMRLRDRRAPLAMVVTATAYLAAILWGISVLLHDLVGTRMAPIGTILEMLLTINALLLGWRLLMRMAFTARLHGAIEALLAAPRFLIGNFVALAAAPKALVDYLDQLRGHPPVWHKTSHAFPDLDPAPAIVAR